MIGDPFQIILVLGIAVTILLLGPKKIPELARSIGQAKKEFEKANNGEKALDS